MGRGSGFCELISVVITGDPIAISIFTIIISFIPLIKYTYYFKKMFPKGNGISTVL